MIYPSLKAGLHLAVRSQTPSRAMMLDSAGKPLQLPSPVYVAGVRPDRLAHPAATARVLGRVTGLDKAQLLGWILAAPRSQFQELVVFSPGQYRKNRSSLARVPGLIIKPESQRLFTSLAPDLVGSVGTEASSALHDQGIAYRPGTTIGLAGLQQAYQRQLAGTPSVEVVSETAKGTHVTRLAGWTGRPARPVRTTVNAGVQRSANAAVGSQPVSAAVVAVQASTGHILAVATHKASGLPRIGALAQGYPPGTAFTIVSTEALLESGLLVNTPVPCTGANDVGGTIFHNVPAVTGLGAKPSFTADFAHACATAFSGLSRRLTAKDLQDVAARYGLGAGWDLRLKTFSGSVDTPGNVAELAADTIGQGSVRMSPLAMALVAAQVDAGARHSPVLVPPGPGTQPPAGPGPRVSSLDTLRSLLRSAAKAQGADAGDLPGTPVRGQSGTVELPHHGHRVWGNWFAGYRGDVAFAVLLISHSPTTSAIPVATRFLAGVPRS